MPPGNSAASGDDVRKSRQRGSVSTCLLFYMRTFPCLIFFSFVCLVKQPLYHPGQTYNVDSGPHGWKFWFYKKDILSRSLLLLLPVYADG